MRLSFQHKPHEHIAERRKHGAVKTREGASNLNDRIAISLTAAVGTMWCAYAFAVLAMLVAGEAIRGGLLTFVQWFSQTFIQLVMLSVIMVGQNILSKASDRRAEMTFKDADATFHEAQQIQAHLEQQDDAINAILDRLEKFEKKA